MEYRLLSPQGTTLWTGLGDDTLAKMKRYVAQRERWNLGPARIECRTAPDAWEPVE